jgi:DNA-binding NarL/FixJ family response regulator
MALSVPKSVLAEGPTSFILDSMRDILEPAAATPAAPHVTPRERDVLSLVALGRSNIAVAEELGLTVSTVKSYMKSIMAKLDAATRYEAAHAARRAGSVHMNDVQPPVS